MTKRVRSDDELVAVLDEFHFLERLPIDVLYYIVFRSGLTVPEVHRLCNINRRFQHICQNRGVWDKLFIEKLIANAEVPERELPKYYDHPLFQEWRAGRANGMPDDFQRFTASVYFYAHTGPMSYTKTGVACRVLISKRAGILWVRGEDYCNLHPFMRDIIDEFADVNDIKTRSTFVVPDANAVRFHYRMLGAGWVRDDAHPILVSGPVKRDRDDDGDGVNVQPASMGLRNMYKDLMYKLVMRSGLAIRDIEALCKSTDWLARFCNGGLWTDLFVERILAKDVLDNDDRAATSLTPDELAEFRDTDEYKKWIKGPDEGMIIDSQRFVASMFFYHPLPDQFIYRKRNVLCRIEVWQRDYDLRVGAPSAEEEEACLEQQDVMEILADLAQQDGHRHRFPFRVPNKNVIQFHYRMLGNDWVREIDHNLLIQGGVKREREEEGKGEGEGVVLGMLREFHLSEELPPEILFKVIFESGVSVIDLIRLCSMSKEWRKLCNNGRVWDKLYIDTFLARSTTRLSDSARRPFYDSPQFVAWHEERATMPKDMVRLVAHAYTTLRVEDIEFHKAPGYVLVFVDSALMDGIEHDTLVYVEFETKGVRKPVRAISLSAGMREVLVRGGLARFPFVGDKAAYLLSQENRLKLYYELLVGGWHPIVKTAAPEDQKKVPAVIMKSAIYNAPLTVAEHEMLACDACGTDKSSEWLQCGKCTRFTFCSHECSDALADVHDAVCINVEKMDYPDYLSKHLQYAIDDAVAMPKEFKASEVEDMRITHELLQLGEEVTDDTIDAAKEWIGVVYHGGAGAFESVGPKIPRRRRRRSKSKSKSKKKAAPKSKKPGRGRSKSRSKSKNKQPNAGSSRRRSQSKSKSKEKKGKGSGPQIGRGRSKSRSKSKEKKGNGKGGGPQIGRGRSKSKSKEKKPAAPGRGRSKSKSKEKKPATAPKKGRSKEKKPAAAPNRGRSKSKSKEKKGKGRSKSKGKKQEGGGDLSPKSKGKKKSSDGATSRSRSRSRSRSDGEDGEKRSLLNVRTGNKKKTTNFSPTIVMPSRRGGGGGGGGQLPSYQPPPPPTPYAPAPAPTPTPAPAQPQVVVVNQTDGRRRRDEPDSDDDRDAASAGNSNDSEEQ